MALRIESFRGLSALAPLRARLDALDAQSRRPCPFSTLAYVEALCAHDEFGVGEVLFLVAFDGDALVGYLPLRKRRESLLGVTYGRIDVLVSHDTDRPHVIARAADEPRCAKAFYRHLLEDEPGWSQLVLPMQDADSALNAVPRSLFLAERRFENMSNTTVPLTFASFEAYFRGLVAPQRKNMARLCRRLLGAGRVEVVSSSDPRARLALLDLYLDLERRSWKGRAQAGIARHPERLAFFRALCDAAQPMQLGFDLVLLDDLPVAGMLSGDFARVLYGRESAFDEDYQDLAPGHLLALMVIRRAHAAGYAAFNFGASFAYYKSKLGGVVTPTWAIQLFRVGTLPWVKALAGDLKRRLFPAAEGGRFNPERRRVEEHEAAAHPPREAERRRARETLQRLRDEGVKLDRIGPDELRALLPFATRAEAA